MESASLVFPSFQFGKDDPALAERLVDLGVGGFCLYRGEAREIASFVSRLQTRARTPLLFCADYEDGTASHVTGGTPLPSNMALGAAGEEALAEEKGRITAVEARALGVRWVFAPVLDLATCPGNPIVNVRAFGASPALVSRMGRAYMRGLSSKGVLPCAKHFPGHGETRKDSHLELPTVTVGAGTLSRRELRPFREAASVCGSVMLAHLYVPAFGDARGLPVTLSQKAVGGVLRRRLGFEGLVATDALNMRAISRSYGDEEAARRALAAGADILLVPDDPVRLAQRLPRLAASDPAISKRIAAALTRLGRARKACGLDRDRGLPEEKELSRVGSQAHRDRAEALASAGLTWVRRPAAPLPARVFYLEPGASSPDQWLGRRFLQGLRAGGVAVSPYRRGAKGTVVAASFLSPRAYSGRIALDPAVRRAASAALKSARASWLLSFGSPYVFDDLSGYGAGLCAFYGGEPAQAAAARVLASGAKAPGRMPVPLRCLGR